MAKNIQEDPMSRVQFAVLRIVSSAAFLLLVFSCGGKGPDYYTLKPVDINYSILASCSVKYPQPLDLYSTSYGKVVKVSASDGNFVRKGQVLVQLDDFSERQNLDIAMKNLASTRLKLENAKNEQLPKLRQQFNQLQSDLDKSKNDLERKKQLFDSNFISKSDVENAENKYQQSLSSYNQVKLSLESYETSGPIADLNQQISIQQSQVGISQKAVDDKKLTAPFDGTVTKVNVQNGQSVQPGMMAVTIVEKSPWVLEAEVDQKELPFLSNGQVAIVSFDAYPQDRVKANTVYVCALVDAQKGTCNLKFEIRENKSYVKFGMTGTVEISAGIYRQKLAIPSRFAEKTEGGYSAWIWNGKSAEKVVLNYDTIGEQWIVVKNLKTGTKFLLPGANVSAAKSLGKEVIGK
jgi:HlyD family secretion protein